MTSAEEITKQIESITDKPAFSWSFSSWKIHIIKWLIDWERDIREEQRKKCWDAVEAQGEDIHGMRDELGYVVELDPYIHRQAILNAGKGE